MQRSYTGRKRFRKSFGRIEEVAPLPNLIALQNLLMKASYNETFLMRNVKKSDCKKFLNLYFLLRTMLENHS